jgi:hypothetical protein
MKVEFLNALDVEYIAAQRWRLLADFKALLIPGVMQTVPAGFVTDFASVPRVPLAFLLCGDTAHKAAVLHDYLYSQGGTDRSYADAVLRAGMAADGEPAWRRWAMWAAVRVFGGRFWQTKAAS